MSLCGGLENGTGPTDEEFERHIVPYAEVRSKLNHPQRLRSFWWLTLANELETEHLMFVFELQNLLSAVFILHCHHLHDIVPLYSHCACGQCVFT